MNTTANKTQLSKFKRIKKQERVTDFLFATGMLTVTALLINLATYY